jgi:hypothetical protein
VFKYKGNWFRIVLNSEMVSAGKIKCFDVKIIGLCNYRFGVKVSHLFLLVHFFSIYNKRSKTSVYPTVCFSGGVLIYHNSTSRICSLRRSKSKYIM